MRTPLTLALTLLLTAPAAAAGPTPPLPVAPATPDGDNPACVAGDRQPGNGGADVAVNAAGDAVVTWTHDAGAGAQVVQAAVRPAGGAFGPPETIGGTLPCAFLGIAGHTPQAAIDRAGNVVVAFAATSGGNVVIRAAQRPAGGSFGTPADLSDDARRADGAPRIAMNEAGLAAVVWSRNNGSKDVVQVAVKPPGGVFAPALDLSNALQNARGASVAVNDGGAIAAAWSRETAGTNSATRTQATVRPAGAAAFVTAQDLSGTGPAREARVGLDAAGRVLVTWLRSEGQTDLAEAGALTPQGVVTGGVDPISEPGEDPNALSVAVEPGGEAVASYIGCGPGPCVARTALRPAGARFATPVTVSPPVGSDARLQSAMAPGGAAAVAVDNNFAGGRLLAAHRSAGGAFGDVAPLSPAGSGAFGAALAVDGEGNAVAAWTAAAGISEPKAVQAAALDAAGPAITALDVPASAGAGAPVRLAAAARDRWTGATLTWDLGDGATAAGGAVEHAFAAGTHTVTLTAADGAGNVTRRTRTLQVTAVPVPPEPEVITSPVLTRWAFKGKRLVLLSMRVARPPAGAKAQLRCRGRTCPFRARTVQRRAKAKGPLAVFKSVSVERALDVRARRFRAGQRVQLRITAPGAVGRVVTFKLKAGREPRGKPACLFPGASTPEACPQ